MTSKLIFLTPDEHGVNLRGPALNSISRVDKYARLSDTQWSVDIFSASASEDENQVDLALVRGAHYKQFREIHNGGTFESAQAVVDYINQYGAADRPTLIKAKGGYELTGGFSARVNAQGQAGANDFGTFVGYTQTMVDAEQWLRFGFNSTSQAANDFAYWTDPDPNEVPGFDQTKGLFGGMHMAEGVDTAFDFDFNESPGYSAGVLGQSLNYTAATGSFDFTGAQVGDLALIRFDFNVIPQVANTTIEVGMIWQTRLADGTPTFAFPLTGTPVFYGTGTVGKTFLNRPILSAYFASNEDVNARALLAVKADNPIQIAPLTTLATLQR